MKEEIAPQQPQAEKTESELIAEFMGGTFYDSADPDHPNKWWFRNQPHEGYRKDATHLTLGLRYSCDWSWLMPVVEKIESIEENMHVVINRNMCHVQFVGSTHRCESKIQAVYQAVVEFIKWYNTQPKQL